MAVSKDRTRTLRALDAALALWGAGALGCTGAGSGASSRGDDSAPPIPMGGQSGEGAIPAREECYAPLPGTAGGRPFAACNLRVGAGDGSRRHFQCCCDAEQCDQPRPWFLDSIPSSTCDGASDAAIAQGCPVYANSCAEAIQGTCGVAAEAVSRCSTWSGSGAVPCFARPEGGFACYCPNESKPSLSDEPDCNTALVEACRRDCSSELGHCNAGGKRGYQCTCANGLTSDQPGPLCERALKICEPKCESAAGACYGEDFSWDFACKCTDRPGWHVTPTSRPIGAQVKTCEGQLEDFCRPAE